MDSLLIFLLSWVELIESSLNKCTSIHKSHKYFHKLLIQRMNLELKEILGLLIPIVHLPKTKNCIAWFYEHLTKEQMYSRRKHPSKTQQHESYKNTDGIVRQILICQNHDCQTLNNKLNCRVLYSLVVLNSIKRLL